MATKSSAQKNLKNKNPLKSMLDYLVIAWSFLAKQVSFILAFLTIKKVDHMAKVNLNKSEELVTNTTTASKHIPKRSRIYHLKSPLSDLTS